MSDAGGGEGTPPAGGRGVDHEKVAVGVSFWAGGFGLAALKAGAYAATGSTMVRTSMYESMGDVVSSAIIWITQWQVSASNDAHRYPVGKSRFAPLGVLVFCAFMGSSMLSTAIEALQTLLAPDEPDIVAQAAGAAVRRLFEDRPRLRWAYGPWRSVDALAAEYSTRFGAQAAGEDADTRVPVMLMASCVVVKCCLFCYCRAVARKKGSDMVRALAADHFNDMFTNSLVICTMMFVSWLRSAGHDGPLVAKLDPGISLLLSLWILYGWISNALDQVKTLSDRRAGAEELDIAAVEEAVARALTGVPLECRGVDAYLAGDGLRVRLDLRPTAAPREGGAGAADAVADVALALSGVRDAVCSTAAESEVLAVDMCIRPRDETGATSRTYVYVGRTGAEGDA